MLIANRIGLLKFVRGKSAIEIGVFKGEYSKRILDITDVEILYSIDPWPKDHPYQEALKTLNPYGDRVKMLRYKSYDIVHIFSEQSQDFIYIDGLHDYKSVKRDLNDWWPKCRTGGIFAGHDYWLHLKDNWKDSSNVKGAVDEFVKENNLELVLTGCSNPKIYEDVGYNGDNWVIFK